MKIDFTQNEFQFISKAEEYFVEGSLVQCIGDYTEWKDDKKISDGWGMFSGKTMVTYNGYAGELPRMDEDTSSFGEFDIYWKNIQINEMIYMEFIKIIQSQIRDEKLCDIFQRYKELNFQKIPIVKEKKIYPFQLGDIVTSNYNTYSKEDPCQIDRLYERKEGTQMARIIWENKIINVPQETLKYHKSHFRNDKLDQLGL
jgi:hypothetical protein